MTTDDILTPGYRFNSSIALRDLNRLLSTFMAIAPIRLIFEGDAEDPLYSLMDLCAEDEIIHLLVSTAVMNRAHLEHMQKLRENPDENTFEPVDGVCGRLWPTNENGLQPVPLCFREACNKIIHTKSTTFENLECGQPMLRLLGRQGKKEWMVEIEVIEYVRLSVRNFQDAPA